jgi:hypothetical protein
VLDGGSAMHRCQNALHWPRTCSILDVVGLAAGDSRVDMAVLVASAWRSGYSAHPFGLSSSTIQRLQTEARLERVHVHGPSACLTGDRVSIRDYRCEMWFRWPDYDTEATEFVRVFHRARFICGPDVATRIAYVLTGRCVATEETRIRARAARLVRDAAHGYHLGTE